MLEDKFNQKSELLEKERNLDTKDISHLKNLFWEFHFQRKPSTDIEPFDPVRIQSHVNLSGISFTPWEYTVLMEMDLIFRATIRQKRG